jgi:hypothetical protein
MRTPTRYQKIRFGRVKDACGFYPDVHIKLGRYAVITVDSFASDPLPTFFGVTYDSNHPDHILGTNGDDQIVGMSRNDVIFGMNGNNVVSGQEGDDIIYGGNGNDILRGRGGADRMDGGDGDDVLWGGADECDQLFGGDGDDFLGGGEGNDLCDGGRGKIAPTVSVRSWDRSFDPKNSRLFLKPSLRGQSMGNPKVAPDSPTSATRLRFTRSPIVIVSLIPSPQMPMSLIP